MKKFKILLAAAVIATGAMGLASCSEDDLNPNSVFTESQNASTPLDAWLETNYVANYNIQFKYRYEDVETDKTYELTPATYEKSIQLAKLVKFLCFEAYDTVTGSREFIAKYFPKIVFAVGCPAYNNNGSVVLGTAEGGSKITLYAVNNLDPTNVALLNEWYFKTIHHEFTHILNQTKPYSTDFEQITGTTSGIEYVGNSCWDVYPTEASANQDGFISRYSSTSSAEDFAELVSIYVTNDATEWNRKLTQAGTSGRAMIESKFEIVTKYMESEWGIDLNVLRAEVLGREAQVPSMDWDSLN